MILFVLHSDVIKLKRVTTSASPPSAQEQTLISQHLKVSGDASRDLQEPPPMSYQPLRSSCQHITGTNTHQTYRTCLVIMSLRTCVCGAQRRHALGKGKASLPTQGQGDLHATANLDFCGTL